MERSRNWPIAGLLAASMLVGCGSSESAVDGSDRTRIEDPGHDKDKPGDSKKPVDPNEPRNLARFFDGLDKGLPKLDTSGTKVTLSAFLAAGTPTTAILQIREEFITDVRPPGAGRRLLSVVLDGSRCSWRSAEAHVFGDRARGLSTGEPPASRGSAWILETCRRLVKAGWQDLPTAMPENRQDLLSGSRFTIRIRLSNPKQHTTLERTLPYGAENDPKYDGAADACRLIDAEGPPR